MGIRRESAFLLFGLEIDRTTWRGVWWFFLTYVAAFLVAAVFGPLLYLWIQGMDANPDSGSVLAYLQEKPFSRYVDRVRVLFAALSLLWLIGACGIWGRFGFAWGRGSMRAFLSYFAVGVVSLGSVVALQGLNLNLAGLADLEVGSFVEILLVSLVGGLLIGWLEESIFRGMVFRMFYTATQPFLAVILSALVFAAVHFKSVPAGLGEPFEWYSGFRVAGFQFVSVFFTVNWLEYANYFLVGVVLNLVFLRTGSLVGCMGLHAGWVFMRNAWGDLVVIQPSVHTQIWGTDGIVDGYASLTILAGIAIGLYVELRKYQKFGQVGLANVS